MMMPKPTSSRTLFAASLFVAVLALAVAACGSTGPYVWVSDMTSPEKSGSDVTIQENDVVNVRVFNQDPLSTKERVRADGKIAMPVIGEVMARGKRPAQLAAEIQERLKGVVVAPSVTVTFEQPADLKVAVVGEVRNAGIYQLEPGANVLTALAAAGGLNDYADGERVFVVRKSLPQRVRFRFNDLRSQDPKSIGFTLQPNDVVVVE